jgi:hypothetical protein
MDMALGFSRERDPTRRYRVFGHRDHESTFGHVGGFTTVAFADPVARLVLVLNATGVPDPRGRAASADLPSARGVANDLEYRVAMARKWCVADAVYADLGLGATGCATSDAAAEGGGVRGTTGERRSAPALDDARTGSPARARSGPDHAGDRSSPAAAAERRRG